LIVANAAIQPEPVFGRSVGMACYAFSPINCCTKLSTAGFVLCEFKSERTLLQLDFSQVNIFATITTVGLSRAPTGIQKYGEPINLFGTDEPQIPQKHDVKPEVFFHEQIRSSPENQENWVSLTIAPQLEAVPVCFRHCSQWHWYIPIRSRLISKEILSHKQEPFIQFHTLRESYSCITLPFSRSPSSGDRLERLVGLIFATAIAIHKQRRVQRRTA
jgi:hypothetical protein